MSITWSSFPLANDNSCDTIECKMEVHYLLQMNVIITFVLLTAEVMVYCLLYWLLFAGCAMGFQKVVKLDSQSVQQSTCLDDRQWILWPRKT